MRKNAGLAGTQMASKDHAAAGQIDLCAHVTIGVIQGRPLTGASGDNNGHPSIYERNAVLSSCRAHVPATRRIDNHRPPRLAQVREISTVVA